MSLKPLKKSDLGKDWMTKRRDAKKSIQPEYHLIVTEGIKTEPNYFNAIKKINMMKANTLNLFFIYTTPFYFTISQ